ncbi:hypothetical protein [Coraliomargarita parva]|uniref:hypothetical protein n=1 Tax=Coraliomargarita parva TaxID=3014050 RepID=UPI0022B59FA8|nr:hypothetical protein [Coraliomargarita parva]
MRIPRLRTAPESGNILKDASGHEWNPERYQTLADGSPRYSSAGNFYLRSGQKHAV